MFALLALATLAGAAPAAPESPPLVIRVDGVVETCLLGEVDAAWVRALLAEEGLVPSGGAMLCGTDLTWSGTRFQEAVFVLGTGPVGELSPGWFLVSALNSRPFFAWVERTKNRSPYWPGRVVVDAGEHAARLTVGGRRAGILDATAAAPASEAVVRTEAEFRGPIHLPGRAWFAAEFTGAQDTWPFQPGVDAFVRTEGSADPLGVVLGAAGFQPRSWSLRAAGVHAKSETQGVRP